MSLRPMQSGDLDRVGIYLKHQEWQHTMLSSRFCRHGKMVIPENSLVYITEKDDVVTGVFLSDQRGYLLMSQHEGAMIPAEILKFCHLATNFYPPYCVAGHPHLLDAAQAFFGKEIRRTIDYHLMTSISRLPCLPDLQETVTLHRSRARDHTKLLRLELKYQEEEVFNRELNMHDKIGLTLLYIEKLKKTPCMHAWSAQDNMAIAKAEIAATAFEYLQLGGVYTLPPWRGKGVAAHVVLRLIEMAHAQNKNLALFVKKDNDKAIALYQKLLMETQGDFRIYYVRD